MEHREVTPCLREVDVIHPKLSRPELRSSRHWMNYIQPSRRIQTTAIENGFALRDAPRRTQAAEARDLTATRVPRRGRRANRSGEEIGKSSRLALCCGQSSRSSIPDETKASDNASGIRARNTRQRKPPPEVSGIRSPACPEVGSAAANPKCRATGTCSPDGFPLSGCLAT